MTINYIISEKYEDLHKYCIKNTIKRIEIQCTNRNDFEDEDIFHTLLIYFLKKYKKVKFKTLDDGYNLIKREIILELKCFSKKTKQKSIYYSDLTDVVENVIKYTEE